MVEETTCEEIFERLVRFCDLLDDDDDDDDCETVDSVAV